MAWHGMAWMNVHGRMFDRGQVPHTVLTSDLQVVDRVGVSRSRKRGPLYGQRLRPSVPNHHLMKGEKS